MTENPLSELRDLLRSEITGTVDPEIAAITKTALDRYGQNACAVMFYGSCLRRGYQDDDVVDLYLTVDRYRGASGSRLTAFLNWLLPPNVVYLETNFGDAVVRAKCAIISIDDFDRGVSGRWFHSYMWARFAQPCRLAHVRDYATTERLLGALVGAARTMVHETKPLMTAPFDGGELWCRALEGTYGAELRAERPGRAAELVEGDRDRYMTITDLLGQAGDLGLDEDGPQFRPSSSGGARLACRVKWFARRIAGKILSVLRLIKAAFTFDDGAVYILWKIERHSGLSVELTPWQRRHPVLASMSLFWRLYRRGAFK